jgi:Ca2+-binding EF-hand superfamily protein
MRCSRRLTLALGFAVPVLFVAPAFARISAAAFIKKWDTDHDGTLDLNEIYKAADVEFDRLDTDHDGTLDLKELRGRVTKAEFDAADSDHDGTLDKAEYRTLVQSRFNAANPDNDGTVDRKELESKAGQRLVQLLE